MSIPALRGQRTTELGEFKASLFYIERLCFKKQKDTLLVRCSVLEHLSKVALLLLLDNDAPHLETCSDFMLPNPDVKVIIRQPSSYECQTFFS